MSAPWLREGWRRLCSALETRRLPHATLLAGPAGLGKREFARAFVARVLCREAKGEEGACGRCRSCSEALACVTRVTSHLAGSAPRCQNRG